MPRLGNKLVVMLFRVLESRLEMERSRNIFSISALD
jgi:hypothetical protein